MERYLMDLAAKDRVNTCKHYCIPKEYCIKLKHRIVHGEQSLYHCKPCIHYERRGLK